MEINRIIVSRTDKIGDLVLSIPSFYMLRKMYPKAELTVLVRNYNYSILKNLPYIDRVVKIDDYTQKDLLKKISYFKPDVFIALYNDSFISALAKSSGAPIRIGPYSKLSSFFAFNKGIYQKRSKSEMNEAMYNLNLVRKLNPEVFDKNVEINNKLEITTMNREIAHKFFDLNKIVGKTLVINPFMGGSAKNISDEQYISLIKKLLERNEELNIILTAHIDDEKRMEDLIAGIGSVRVHPFLNGGDLLNTAAIIEKGDLYFGGSTGPTHIAGALGKRVIGIYPAKKSQSTVRWGVFGNEKVEYIIPDANNSKENYSHKYFDSYTDKTEQRLIEMIERNLNRGDK